MKILERVLALTQLVFKPTPCNLSCYVDNEPTRYRYQGNVLREGFFCIEKTSGEREYTGYNLVDVDVARVARTQRTHR